MSPTPMLPSHEPALQHRALPGARAPAPVLAQVQAIAVPEGSERRVAELLTALRRRAAAHPGHIGPIGTGDAEDHRYAAHASLWSSVPALLEFVHASHTEITAWQRRTGLRVRAERALWWVADGEPASISEARERLDHLRRHGPGPRAFTLRSPVPPPRR